MNYETWVLFSAIAVVATITPGPAIMLVSANSSSYGVQKAIYTILGNIKKFVRTSITFNRHLKNRYEGRIELEDLG